MVNQREIHSYDNQVDTFTDALATARKMQQDWLTYGLDFVHFYVEDVDGDWLETWGHSETLDHIKEFLVSNDDIAVKIRRHLEERSLFDFAVNLEECWRIFDTDDRLCAVKNLLVNQKIDDIESANLANSLLSKLAEIL